MEELKEKMKKIMSRQRQNFKKWIKKFLKEEEFREQMKLFF